MMRLQMPFPPSVNACWRNAARTLLSEKARRFHQAARAEILGQLWQMRPRPEMITAPVAVKILLHPPDARRRDLDNMAKALLDALTHAGIWQDDCLVHELALAWGERKAGGVAVVEIWEIQDLGRFCEQKFPSPNPTLHSGAVGDDFEPYGCGVPPAGKKL